METTNIVLNDVIFFYAKIKEPGLKYGSQTDREYSVNCLITKADMQKLKAMKVNKTIKNIEEEGILDKYPGGDGRYLVTFKSPTHTTTGKELVVKAFDPKGKELDCLIGNGSKGSVKVWLFEGQGLSKGKMNSRLTAIKVDKLVEFEKKGGGSAGDDFSFESDSPF